MGQSSQDIEKSRLAAARGADDGDEFRLFDSQRHAAEGLHIDPADAVSFAHIVSFDHERHAESLMLHDSCSRLARELRAPGSCCHSRTAPRATFSCKSL